jgi:hypothetical protein
VHPAALQEPAFVAEVETARRALLEALELDAAL